MKLKELLYLFGIWRPQIKTYGFTVTENDLPNYGKIKFAQWLHPKQHVVKIEQDAITELKKYLQDGDVAVDIGAHIGDTAVPMAVACGPSGMVFALEPNKYVYPVLLENAKLVAEYGTIVPLNFAAAEQDGKVTFEYSDDGFCNGGLHKNISVLQHGHVFKLEVEGKNLLNFLSASYRTAMQRIRFIKTDCEGYDLYVIKSIWPLITENKPYLKIEIHKNTSGIYREELFNLLANAGYDIFVNDSESVMMGRKMTLSDMGMSEHFDIFCVNNSHQ